jgi:hypothetical protein
MRPKKDFQNGSSMMPHHFQVSYSSVFFLLVQTTCVFCLLLEAPIFSGRCAKRGPFSRGNQHSDAEPLGEDAALPPSSQSLLADEELCIYTNVYKYTVY